jgi:DNA-binding PadR family transcriptional regulator
VVAVSGEVAHKVKRFILDSERFTVNEVARFTSLNPKSVETVIQRLVRDGFVVQTGEKSPGKGPGRPSLYYELTPNLDKQLELLESVQAFNIGETPVALAPSSAHYAAAKDLLDALERDRERPDLEEQLALVDKHLRLAAFEEGVDTREPGSEVVAAYLGLLSAQAAMLRKRWDEAEKAIAETRARLEQLWSYREPVIISLDVMRVTPVVAPRTLEADEPITLSLPDVSPSYPLAFALERPVSVSQMRIGSRAFDVYPYSSEQYRRLTPPQAISSGGAAFSVVPHGNSGPSEVKLNPGEDYFVLPPPQEERERLGAQDEDYVLVRQCGVDVDEEKGVVWGRFVRNPDGSINFVPPDIERPTLIGNIVAVLRPSKEEKEE